MDEIYYDDLLEQAEKWQLKETCTIQELITILCKYPKELKIVTTWESTINSIQKRDLYLSKCGKFVYLDADSCSYKDEFAKDPKENED